MLIIVDNVYKGLSLIVCATIVTLTLIATFRPYTAGFHQLIVSNSVNLLNRTICTTVVVRDWCITNVAHGWWVSIQSIVCIVRGRN